MKKTRLLFYITTLDGGGAEKVLINLLKKLDLNKYQVTIVSLMGGVYKNSIPKGIDNKVILKRKSLVTKILMKISPAIFSLFFLHGKYDYEVAFLEGRPTRVIYNKHSKAKKIAFVHCDISVNNPIKNYYKDKAMCYREYRSFHKVCFVSDDAKKAFEKEIGKLENALVIHNIQDFSKIEQLSQEKVQGYTTHGLKILTVGRLSPEKGYGRLVEIAGELEKKYNFELLIIGDGKERPEIEEYIKSNKITSVKLMGYLENPYPYFKEAELYVCSSFYEGYSTSCVEAIHLGLPVLTTKCSGMEEILNNSAYGRIVENSKDGLKDGLIEVLNNPFVLNRYKKCIEENVIHESSMKEYDALFES